MLRGISAVLAIVLGTAALAEWTTIAEWSGNGIKNTESFDVASREWRVAWTVREGRSPGNERISITVKDGDDDSIVAVAGSQRGAGTDTSYVRSPPGRYYLEVTGTGSGEWTVTAQDQR